MANDKWELLFPPDSVIHRVFLKGEYGDCISVGSKTRVISSQTISSMLRQQPRPAAHRAKFELKGADVNETIS
jgi:hypothetical protein